MPVHVSPRQATRLKAGFHAAIAMERDGSRLFFSHVPVESALVSFGYLTARQTPLFRANRQPRRPAPPAACLNGPAAPVVTAHFKVTH
jgi:hypothetical protein